MKAEDLARALKAHLRESEDIMWSDVTGSASIAVGAWGLRQSPTLLLVDKDGDKYDLLLIPTSEPERYDVAHQAKPSESGAEDKEER